MAGLLVFHWSGQERHGVCLTGARAAHHSLLPAVERLSFPKDVMACFCKGRANNVARHPRTARPFAADRAVALHDRSRSVRDEHADGTRMRLLSAIFPGSGKYENGQAVRGVCAVGADVEHVVELRFL